MRNQRDPRGDPRDKPTASAAGEGPRADPPAGEPRDAQKPEGLKASGLKATVPRMKILALFERSPVRHLSAEDVYRMLLAEHRDIGLATVYRVLTQFEQAGLLQRHHFESGKAVFELNDSQHHDHIVCMQCGRVEEFTDEEIERRQADAALNRGFAIRAHSLYVYADCTRERCPHRERT